MGTKPVCNPYFPYYNVFHSGKLILIQWINLWRLHEVHFQAQYSYTVVETLMAHLDENAKSSPTIRTSIAGVLAKIIAIAAGESVGKKPSIVSVV